jgi:type VI protein secretion system component VasK
MPGRYAIPWCLVLGEKGAGQSTILQNTGLHMSRSVVRVISWLRVRHCRFYFYDKGVAIDLGCRDLAGRGTVRTTSADCCVTARPKRPLDAVLVVIGASSLVGR